MEICSYIYANTSNYHSISRLYINKNIWGTYNSSLHTPYEAFTLNIAITVAPNYLDHPLNELKSMLQVIINNHFSNFIQKNYPSNTLVFTDGSVTSSKIWYANLIPDLHIQSSANLSPHVSNHYASDYKKVSPK